MPFIDAKISIPLDAEQKEELKSAFGEAIALIPGKEEASLMVAIADGVDLWLGGKKLDKAAEISVEIFGEAAPDAISTFAGRICEIMEETCHIPSDAVYIPFKPVYDWGSRGQSNHYNK